MHQSAASLLQTSRCQCGSRFGERLGSGRKSQDSPVSVDSSGKSAAVGLAVAVFKIEGQEQGEREPPPPCRCSLLCGVCDLQYLTVGLDFGTAFAFGSHYLLTARHNIEPFPDLREKRSFTGVWLTDADGEKEQRHSIFHINKLFRKILFLRYTLLNIFISAPAMDLSLRRCLY